MKTISKDELQKILASHAEWLADHREGNRADLSDVDLRGADLHRVDLRYSDLHNADLRNADLSRADLRRADLRYADLSNADLKNADLSNADLKNADLSGADLNGADLIGAVLDGANLSSANLSHADLTYAEFGETRIWTLDRIGSCNRRTTYDATHDVVLCGCFCGTFAEWRAKIRKTHKKGTLHRKEYDAAVAYFVALRKAYGLKGEVK